MYDMSLWLLPMDKVKNPTNGKNMSPLQKKN